MDAYIPPEVRRAARAPHNEDARPEPAPCPLTPWTDLSEPEKIRQLVSSGAMSAAEGDRLRQEHDEDMRNVKAAGLAFALIFVSTFVAIALWG